MDTLNMNGVEYVAVDEFTEFTENHHNHMVTDEHVKYLDKISHILPEHIKAEQDCIRVNGVKYVPAVDFLVLSRAYGEEDTVLTDNEPKKIIIGGEVYINGNDHQHLGKDYKILKDYLAHIREMVPLQTVGCDIEWNFQLIAHNALKIAGGRISE